MPRLAILLLIALVLPLASCQSGPVDLNEKPRECTRRAIENGLCVPGEYENY